MRTPINAYLNAYSTGGTNAVWSLVQGVCETDAERQAEVDEIEAAGWLVQRHFNSDSADGEMDEVYFEPRTRRHT